MKTEKQTLVILARRAARLSRIFLEKAMVLTPDGKGRAGGPTTWYTASIYGQFIYESGKAMGEAEGYRNVLQLGYLSNTSNEETQ